MSFKRWALVAFSGIIVIVCWLYASRLVATYLFGVSSGDKWLSEWGQAGDSFGAINALFSGMTLVVAIAILLYESAERESGAKSEHKSRLDAIHLEHMKRLEYLEAEFERRQAARRLETTIDSVRTIRRHLIDAEEKLSQGLYPWPETLNALLLTLISIQTLQVAEMFDRECAKSLLLPDLAIFRNRIAARIGTVDGSQSRVNAIKVEEWAQKVLRGLGIEPV